MSQGRIYCIDTSALIDGWKEFYRPASFPRLWNNLSELVDAGRLIAPEEVFKELEGQDDELFAWVKLRRSMFVTAGSPQFAVLTTMVSMYPQLADPIRSAACASTADQMLVALAKTEGGLLVAHEKQGAENRPKIPELCRRLGVTQIRLPQVVTNEGWVF